MALPGFTAVPHYYGDVIRWFFMAAAAAILLTHPLYANTLRVELPFTLAGALILIILAALTNPHNRNIIAADAVVAGVGMLVYQGWALSQYESSTVLEFGLRQAIAVLFMVALYFSLKTFRAMLLGKIGRRFEPREFDKEPIDEEDIVSSPNFSEEGVDDHLRAEREKELDIMDDPAEEGSRPSSSYAPGSPKAPVNEYITRAARQRNLDIDDDSKGDEDEVKRRARVEEEKARRDKELNDIVAGRQ